MANSPRPTTAVVRIDPALVLLKSQGQLKDQQQPDWLESIPAPSVTEPLYADGREAFFPIPPYDAVYEIAIRGVFQYRVHCTGPFTESNYEAQADALSHVSQDSGRHDWLRINGYTLDYWLRYGDALMLQADYPSHTYRFRIQDDPGKQLTLLLSMSTTARTPACLTRSVRSLGTGLTADVRALPAASVTLPGPRAKAKAKEEANRAVEITSPPAKLIETDDAYRERWVRNVERSNDDMRAVLAKIAGGRQKLMDDLEVMNLDQNGDIYLQYKAEIESWTARQLVQFAERRGADHATATLIG